ncbi:hypothetical protein ACKWMY_27805 [Serratia sp. J2]|uniref:hypothetical protein n=1 Tax=Serratia sp. J2 TaxID=3386551 RepID=UPI00391711F8
MKTIDNIYSELLFNELITEFEAVRHRLKNSLEYSTWPDDMAWLNDDNAYVKPIVDQAKDIGLKGSGWRAQWSLDHVLDNYLYGRNPEEMEEEFSMLLFRAAVKYHWARYVWPIDPSEGWKALREAISFFNQCDGMIAHHLWIKHRNEDKENRQQNARMGGLAKAERFIKVKHEVIRLLYEKMPKGGWKNKASAVEAIEESLWQFVEERDNEITKENQKLPTSEQKRKATGIKKENLVRRILDWSRDDKSIHSAFKETGRKKETT